MVIKNKTQRLTLAGFFVALGIILPFALGHGMGIPGTLLLPMHLPVLLCGMILPILNCLMTGMPAPFPMLPIMFFELALYGLVSGLLFSKTPLGKLKYGIYIALPIAMLCGRLAYAAAFYSILLAVGELKALTVGAAIIAGLPGILIQLLIIPPIVLMLKRNIKA